MNYNEWSSFCWVCWFVISGFIIISYFVGLLAILIASPK